MPLSHRVSTITTLFHLLCQRSWTSCSMLKMFLLQHLWFTCIFCHQTNSLEFTAWSSAGSSCSLRTVLGKTWRHICLQDIRSISTRCYVIVFYKLIYLLTYLLTVRVRNRISKFLVSFILHLNNGSWGECLSGWNVLHPLSNGDLTWQLSYINNRCQCH